MGGLVAVIAEARRRFRHDPSWHVFRGLPRRADSLAVFGKDVHARLAGTD